jgi:hypothetical protein
MFSNENGSVKYFVRYIQFCKYRFGYIYNFTVILHIFIFTQDKKKSQAIFNRFYTTLYLHYYKINNTINILLRL